MKYFLSIYLLLIYYLLPSYAIFLLKVLNNTLNTVTSSESWYRNWWQFAMIQKLMLKDTQGIFEVEHLDTFLYIVQLCMDTKRIADASN